MRLLFGFKRTEAQHAIKRDKRDLRHGAHNLILHCSTMRRRMYGGGSSGDDEGAPPSPPLGMALADATADMWQRMRRRRPKPPSPVWRGAGGDDGVDVKGENR